jgi:hypothetical protein
MLMRVMVRWVADRAEGDDHLRPLVGEHVDVERRLVVVAVADLDDHLELADAAPAGPAVYPEDHGRV